MTEILRYRMSRSPRRLGEDERAFYRILGPNEEPSQFLSAVREAIRAPLGTGADEATRRRELALRIMGAAQAIASDDTIVPLMKFIRELDVSLLKFVPAPTRKGFESLLEEVLARAPLVLPPAQNVSLSERLVSWPVWANARRGIGDGLVFLHLLRFDVLRGEGPAVTGGLDNVEIGTRWLLLMGLIEAVANGRMGLQSAADISDMLFRRTVLLPSPPFPLQVYVPLLAATRFARRPAFMDLVVVREEWCCFVPGELAYIENVLKGEVKERSQHQLDEREITDSREDATLRVREDSTDTTERSSFQEDAQRELQLSVALQGQVDLSGSYGTVQFAAHVGAELQLGYSQTERRTSEQAREVVDRIANRQEQRVRQVRTERTLRRSEERNTHTIDNAKTPTGHVVGIYRWVDKIKRLRNFIYPHRYAFEFQLAEPGARLRWLLENQPPPAMLTPIPPFLTVDGKDTGAALSPDLVSRDNYLQLVGLFRAQGVPDPPPSSLDVAGAIPLKAEQQLPADAFESVQVVPRAVGTAELGIPPGYLGVRLRAVMAAVPQLGTWRDSPSGLVGSDYHMDMAGYHAIMATVSVGSARINLQNTTASVVQSFNAANGVEMPAMWLGSGGAIFAGEVVLPGPLTQQASVAATLAGSFQGHATVALQCNLSDQAEGEWQRTVYERLVSAQQAWQARYDDERRNQATASGIAITGDSPAKYRERVQEELKRQIIELLIARDFDGYQLIRAVDGQRGPLPNFPVLAAATPTIQFLEQAFEWHNISYVPYPFYWTDRSGWPTLERLRQNDADWERFLRCGSARVVVPARPGYEYAIEYYSVTGEPWGGGAAPTPDHPLYVSVAQEIREITGGGDQGLPEDMWESRQPTTLIWLDPDASMPKRNDYSSKAFDGEPNPKLCPDKP